MAATNLTTTVSAKGQVILPKAVRDRLHWASATRLTVEQTAEGVLLKPMRNPFPPTRPEGVFGCLAVHAKPRTIEQVADGIAEEVKRRHAPGRH